MLKHQIRDPRTRHAEAGFTLIELLIVIVVLGILAGIVVFGVSTFRSDSISSACGADMKQVQTAAEAYNAGHSEYPANVTTMITGGYLKNQPANQDYRIVYTGTNALTVNGIAGFRSYTITGTAITGGTCPAAIAG